MMIFIYILLYLFLFLNVQFSCQQYEPIRIYVDKSYLRDRVEDEAYLNDYLYALDKAKNTLEKLINVTRYQNEIDISQYNIFNTSNYEGFRVSSIDQNLLNGNFKPEADLVIFVREMSDSETEECDEKVQILEKHYGRPIIGYIGINKEMYKKFDKNYDYRKELLSSVILHQFTHLLGFMKSEFVDKQLIKIEKKIVQDRIKSSGSRDVNKDVIISENLNKFAQNYFNCSNINFIELEDCQKEKCTEYIHWEARILLGEYMTSILNVQDQCISEFTLISLDEMGFYRTNKYTGGLMRFGKHTKCSFFEEDCNKLL